MFDNLVESEAGNKDLRSRRRYFAVSSIVVGILFTSAVVFSIYAAEYNIAAAGFELVELISPEEMEPVADDTEPPMRQSSTPPAGSQIPSRQIIMAAIEESPGDVPAEISVTANKNLARPTGNYELGRIDTDATPGPGAGSGRVAGATPASGGTLSAQKPEVEPAEHTDPPPPAIKPPASKPRTQSLGVINGKALSLPKPAYPPAAVALNLQGKVNVQVLIDESGKVISANALSGHPVLKAPAEKAALGAKFSTTYLSNVPVKVSGVIVYNFSR
jgi:TonB family protein